MCLFLNGFGGCRFVRQMQAFAVIGESARGGLVKPLSLHPDRALPAEPGVRDIARRLYARTGGLPLVCMHGHVDAEVLAADEPFQDPARLMVVPDHYVTRMLVSQGVSLDALGVPRLDGGPVEGDPRAI